MALSIEARKREWGEIVRKYDLLDLKGAEFQRLLLLAHAEGLLAGFLQDIGALDRQGRYADFGGVSGRAKPLENQSIGWPWRGPRCLRSASDELASFDLTSRLARVYAQRLLEYADAVDGGQIETRKVGAA